MTEPKSVPLASELAAEATGPSLAAGGGEAGASSIPADSRRRFGPLSTRLADQGLFLFRRRSLFVVFLLPAAALAVLERRSAADAADQGLGWFALCLTITLFGLAIRTAALGAAPPGASTRSRRAPNASMLNVSGMYSLSRHPVYLGNLFVLVGFALALRSWWFALTAVLVYWLLYERVIAAEERFLGERFGAAHRRWAERTPTFWPRLGLWRRADTAFSWRTVLLREYNSLLLIAATFLVLRLIDQVVVHGMSVETWLDEDRALVVSVLALALLTAAMRWWRKRGRSGH